MLSAQALQEEKGSGHPPRVFPGVSVVKNPPANVGDTEDPGSFPGSGRSPRVGKRQPTPVFLAGEPHAQRSLAGYSP